MSVSFVIFHPMDPRGAKVGGAETFVRGLIRHAPPDFDVELVGVASEGRARGAEEAEEAGRGYRFRPVIRVADESRRGAVPLSLRFTLALWPQRELFRGRTLFFNRIEPMLAFRRVPGPKLVAIHNDVSRQIAGGPGEVRWSRIPRLYFAMEARCLAAADLAFSESRATVEECRRRYPALRDRIEWLPTWFDSDLFFPSREGRAEEKRRLASRHSALRAEDEWILFAGRYQPQKAPIRLIEAFDLVRRRRSGARLLLSGEGMLKEAMVRAVSERGLQGRVVFLDSLRRPELGAWHRAADAFLLGSDYEGMPIGVLEALACGLPVASTPVGEVPSLVTAGVTGEIAAECSAPALADALERLLANRARYSAADCAASVAAYTPGAVLGPLYGRIRRLADQRGGGMTR